MGCKCFTCRLHQNEKIPEKYKRIMECIYYATEARANKNILRILTDAGYKAGSLGDTGIAGEMKACEVDLEYDEYALVYLMSELSIKNKVLINSIYKRGKK